MDPEIQEYIKELKARAKAARNWANLTSLVGFAGLPIAFIFIIADNKWPAISAMSWFVGHFIGYLAKCAQQELVQSEQQVLIAEETTKLTGRDLNRQDQATARFHNRISLN